MKALIIDDDFSTHEILKEILHKYGNCDVETDGDPGFFAFKEQYFTESKYDVILLDIMLPTTSGIDVLERIRNFEESEHVAKEKRTKIIMITSSQDKMYIVRSIRGHADKFLKKPIERKRLINILKSLKVLN
ncbi:MAG: response regulator [Candidatus Zixiibacteriota bacterium]